MFRNPKGVVLCIDEIEQIGNKEKQTLRELLNAAYKKGMQIKRMRRTKIAGQEMQVVETFEPYFPIAMANISGVDEVLGDRCVVLVLEKSKSSVVTKKMEDYAKNGFIRAIKANLDQISVVMQFSVGKKLYTDTWNEYIEEKYRNYTTTLTTYNTYNNITTLLSTTERIERDELFLKIDSAGFNGRNLEIVFPMILTARLINEDTFLEMIEISKRLIAGKEEEEYAESKDVSLYDFVAQHGKLELTPIKEITSHFRLFVGDTSSDEMWLNDKWMGRALKRLRLIKLKKRKASGIFVLLDIEKARNMIKLFKNIEET